MREAHIGLQLHYIPINKQPYYKSLGYGEELTPMMDRYYSESFTLPCYPLLTYSEQEYVSKTLVRILKLFK
jgi:dTDP-4-amino-4,6-dideoxygalactose transaminase